MATADEPEIYARIRQRSASLSRTKLAVAEYLLTRVEDAAFWPAARLARAVGVSESVVVRLSVELGYSGYPDMQHALQELVRQRLHAASTPRRPRTDPGGSAVYRAFSSNSRILDDTERLNDGNTYETAVAALLGARQIVTVGMRMAHPVAYALAFNIQLFLGNAAVLTAGADVVEDGVRRYGPGDVAVACDFRPYNPMTVEVARALRARGVATVALVDSPLAPAAEGAVATLLTSTEGDFGGDRSLVGAMAVVSALTALLCERGGDRCQASVQETMSLRMAFGSKLWKERTR